MTDLKTITEDLETMLRVYEQKEAAAIEDLNIIRAERKRVQQALNLLNGERKKTTNSKKEVKWSPVVDKVLDYMTEHKEVDDWTIKQLSSAIGVHTSSIGKAMSYLRVNDKIRATRKVRGGGNAYAVW